MNDETEMKLIIRTAVIAVVLRLFLYACMWLFGISIQNHQRTDLGSFRWEHLQNWDGYWYLKIADQGYPRVPKEKKELQTYRFFPGYPLSIRVLNLLTGFSAASAMILSQILYLVLILLLYVIARDMNKSPPVSKPGLQQESEAGFWTLAGLLAFPSSFILALPYSEVLFMTTAFGYWWALRKRFIWIAFFLGMIAGATRITGFFIFALPLLENYFNSGVRSGVTNSTSHTYLKSKGSLFASIFSPWIGAFWAVVFLAWSSGNWDFGIILSAHAIEGYKFSFPWVTIFHDWKNPEIFWMHYPFYGAMIVFLGFRIKSQPALSLYALMLLVFHLCHGTLAAGSRMVLDAWPFFLVFGLWARFNVKSAVIGLAVMAFWQAFFLVRFINGYWVF
jgi:hypothetical protein